MTGPTHAAANLGQRGEAAAAGLRAAKSADAFCTISEVAGELDVPQHVLRFWETKFTQVKPLKRGGGRRYYRPEDVDLLRAIRVLLYNDGYTIKGVQKLLRDGGIKSVRKAPAEAEAEPGGKERRMPVFPPSPPEHRAATLTPAAAGEPAIGVSRKPLDPETRAMLKALLGELQALRNILK